jgi:hypothetical protein
MKVGDNFMEKAREKGALSLTKELESKVKLVKLLTLRFWEVINH